MEKHIRVKDETHRRILMLKVIEGHRSIDETINAVLDAHTSAEGGLF